MVNFERQKKTIVIFMKAKFVQKFTFLNSQKLIKFSIFLLLSSGEAFAPEKPIFLHRKSTVGEFLYSAGEERINRLSFSII